jgi:DNA-directed RNA polymerase specialized sigma subunit
MIDPLLMDFMYGCCIDERNKQIMYDRFVTGMTYEEIGFKHCRSKDRMHQIVRRTLWKMKRKLKRSGVCV